MLQQPVLIIDTEGYVPPEDYRVCMKDVISMWRETKMYSEEEITWMSKIHDKSGLGDLAHLPPAIHPVVCRDQPKTDLANAYVECKLAVCGAIEGLLQKTGLHPKDVDILVTTCSIYCPTPSMASMVVNHLKMKSDIQSYHLGGMGCSNGVVAINMIQDLLRAHPNKNAVFVTTEVTTPAFYGGHDKHRMVTNMLFRMGAAAVLLSNKSSWPAPKYKLTANHRVHLGQNDEAYTAIQYGPDEAGVNGIYLGKNVVSQASLALTKALWKVAPSVLTPGQKAKFAVIWAIRKLFGPDAAQPYTPTFSGAPVQHFLVHAGGAKVLDGIGKALQLTEYDMEPSRMVLRDYGNVSSSTTWYTLGFIESMRGVRKGDTILQVGVGSGIKCGINVWKALRDIDCVHNAWAHRLDENPARVDYLNAQQTVDCGGHAMIHTAMRVLFMLLMGAMMFMFMVYQERLSNSATSSAEL